MFDSLEAQNSAVMADNAKSKTKITVIKIIIDFLLPVDTRRFLIMASNFLLPPSHYLICEFIRMTGIRP